MRDRFVINRRLLLDILEYYRFIKKKGLMEEFEKWRARRREQDNLNYSGANILKDVDSG